MERDNGDFYSRRHGHNANAARNFIYSSGSNYELDTPHLRRREPAYRSSRSSTLNKDALTSRSQEFGIPEGYSLKNWDPSEEPILLLASVFDANSLGKWIYDWTTFNRASKKEIEISNEVKSLLNELITHASTALHKLGGEVDPPLSIRLVR